MKRVLLLGATGMLGSAVYDVLKDRYELLLAVRNPEKVGLLERAHGGTGQHTVVPFEASAVYQDYVAKRGHPGPYFCDFLRRAGDVDHVINTIGVTIPFSMHDPASTFFVNGALPHLLARAFGERLIHITTDCVYSGRVGFPYDETSPKTPADIYGLSKALGEPAECLTIRTSIIGRELNGFTGLLEWFLRQEGKVVSGYTEHYWNGVTTHEFGELCHRIMQSPSGRRGVYHVFSTVVSKYQMLVAFQRRYGIRCTIVPENEKKLNRTLTTVKELNGMLRVPSFEEMVDALP
jgi:dTDP-4-dehydrorhamnose reductase